jgi:tetratricopeptide (TPR) repeat protein
LSTGRDVIKATPGNPEAYQFFADLAFEVGQPKIAVDSLRQAVRVNPGDEASLKALAKTLADEFQTPEAIELYWRAFEKAPDLESQTQIVVSLSNLYLRSNQFPKLIERLELRSRELNLPTEMNRCIATAYREAGDFQKAATTLELLLTDSLLDSEVLRSMAQLAEEGEDYERAIELQEQVATLSRDERDIEILKQLQIRTGRSPSDSLDVRLDSANGVDSLETTLRGIDRTIDSGDHSQALLACIQARSRYADNWEVMLRLARQYAVTGNPIEARKCFRLILRDQQNYSTPSVLVTSERWIKINPTRDEHDTASMLTALRAVYRTEKIESYSGIDRNFEASNRWLVRPAEFFGAAHWAAVAYLLCEGSESEQQADLGFVAAPQFSEQHGILIWTHIAFDRLSFPVGTSDAILDSLNGRESCLAHLIRIELVGDHIGLGRDSKTSREKIEEFGNQASESLLTLIQKYPREFCDHSWKSYGYEYADYLSPVTQQIEQLVKNTDSVDIALAAAFAAVHIGDFKLARLCVDRLRQLHLALKSNPQTIAESFLLLGRLRDGYWFPTPSQDVAAEWINGVLTLLPMTCETTASSIVSPGTGDFGIETLLESRFSLHSWKDGMSWFSYADDLGLDDLPKKWLKDATDIESECQDELLLLSAQYHFALNEREESLFALVQACEASGQSPEIKVLVANRAQALGLNQEAVELIASLPSVRPELQITVDWTGLFAAKATANEDQMVIFAKRVFGSPMSLRQQQTLVPILQDLGLHAELEAINARLGRGAETRQSVLGRKLQAYEAQGNDQLAGEVAWELLKLASGGTLFSGTRPNDDRDDGGERLQAIKALGKLKRLQPLIDRYEAMLEASPESLDLLEILCEFHEAAEQFPQLAEKRDRIALLSKKAPPSLKAKAVALENSGDVSGACDIYLQILKDDPEAFAEEMETYVQAFERAKRRADFLTAVLSLDEDLWSGNAALLINVTADLARAKSHDDVVKRSVEAMLANEETRRLAIGGFLARPDVIAEEKLLPAIQEELTSESAFESYVSINETFLILQGIKQESSLKSLRDFVSSRRAAGRQHSVSARNPDEGIVNASEGSNTEGSHPPLAEAKEELLLVFLNARLGDRAEVEKQLTAMLVDVARKAPSSGLSATFSPAGEKGQDDGAVSASVGDSTRQRRQDSFPAGEK